MQVQSAVKEKEKCEDKLLKIQRFKIQRFELSPSIRSDSIDSLIRPDPNSERLRDRESRKIEDPDLIDPIQKTDMFLAYNFMIKVFKLYKN